jgi:hypothetical protein
MDELAGEEAEYTEEEEEPEMPPEPPPEEEPYHEPTPEPAEEAQVAAPEEGAAEDEGTLPAFYRPRQRPTPKAPEPAKDD